MDIPKLIGKYLLRPNNARVVSPPGKLRPGNGPLVLVPTIPRSGTHLLIDTIINNFPLYKRRPLYVDVDRLLETGDPDKLVDALINCGGYVLKTHYPLLGDSEPISHVMHKLARYSRIVSVTRDLEDVYQSTLRIDLNLGLTETEQEFRKMTDRFAEFWQPYMRVTIPYTHLVNRNQFPVLVMQIADLLGIKQRDRLVYSFAKTNRLGVYLAKVSTRLLGNYSPVVNTTIAFAKVQNSR